MSGFAAAECPGCDVENTGDGQQPLEPDEERTGLRNSSQNRTGGVISQCLVREFGPRKRMREDHTGALAATKESLIVG